MNLKLLTAALGVTIAALAAGGASAQTLEDSVLSVIEREMNGSPGLIYMESVAQADGTGAISELGFKGPQGEHIVVLENTAAVHNVVVCTLCSCYPISLLGPSPSWYKSEAYRSRIVLEPRAVLAECGLEPPASTEILVHDTSAESRHMVLPLRPDGTDGLDEAALAALVTRDGLIGTAAV